MRLNLESRWICGCLVALCTGGVTMPSSGEMNKRHLVSSDRGILGTAMERSASLSIGDLDGDQDLDIVVANGRHWPAVNRIFLNSGDGRFRRMRPLGPPGGDALTSYASVLGDLDDDGDLDIVVGNDREPNQLFFNLGDGHFEQGPSLDTESIPTRSVHIADLDGDEDLDVLVINRGRSNRSYLNDGSAQFKRGPDVGEKDDATVSVAIGDLNEDGRLDLFLANRNGQTNRVLLSRASDRGIEFEEGTQLGTPELDSRAVALGDLNRDGHLDLVMMQIGAANAVFLGDGRGGYTKRVAFGAEDGRSFAASLADLDRDEDLDIVVGNSGQANRVFWNDGSGESFRSESFGDADGLSYGVAIGDLDGDGFEDVAVANSGSHNRVFWNKPKQE